MGLPMCHFRDSLMKLPRIATAPSQPINVSRETSLCTPDKRGLEGVWQGSGRGLAGIKRQQTHPSVVPQISTVAFGRINARRCEVHHFRNVGRMVADAFDVARHEQ